MRDAGDVPMSVSGQEALAGWMARLTWSSRCGLALVGRTVTGTCQREETDVYGLVVTVAITDFENARKELQERLPEMKRAPGFVGGYWLAPADGVGMSVTAFESEDQAKAMQQQMQPGTKLNDYVTVRSVELREVVANA